MFQEIRVKTVLNNVYRENGRDPFHRGGNNDADSLNTLELEARRKAFRRMESSDRVKLRKMIENFRDKTEFGEDAALAVMMRLGIFFMVCEKRMKHATHV